MDRLIDWLFDWLFDWLVGWLVDWLIDWLSSISRVCRIFSMNINMTLSFFRYSFIISLGRGPALHWTSGLWNLWILWWLGRSTGQEGARGLSCPLSTREERRAVRKVPSKAGAYCFETSTVLWLQVFSPQYFFCVSCSKFGQIFLLFRFSQTNYTCARTLPAMPANFEVVPVHYSTANAALLEKVCSRVFSVFFGTEILKFFLGRAKFYFLTGTIRAKSGGKNTAVQRRRNICPLRSILRYSSWTSRGSRRSELWGVSRRKAWNAANSIMCPVPTVTCQMMLQWTMSSFTAFMYSGLRRRIAARALPAVYSIFFGT